MQAGLHFCSCYVLVVAIFLVGKRELIALLNLSSWCLLMVERLFLAVTPGCLQFVIVVFPDHTQLLFPATRPRYTLLFFCQVSELHLSVWLTDH